MKKSTLLLACLLGSYALSHAQSLGNYVWHDANMNGRQDVSEVGVPNIEARLYDSNNTLLATTLTDVNGFYEFTNVAAGSYYVEFGNIPASAIWTLQDGGADDSQDSDVNYATNRTSLIIVTANQDLTTVDAGLVLGQTSNVAPIIIESLEISPNPAQNEVQLTFVPNFSQKEVSVKIMNLEGKIIERKEIGVRDIQPIQLSFDISHLTSGMYLIQISSSDAASVTRKLVVY